MADWTHRTMIVPADLQPLAQQLCAALAGPAGAGMFTTGLSATGAEPASHYISAGLIEQHFAELLADAAMLHAVCQQAGIDVTAEQCADLLARSNISEGNPHAAIAALGLSLVQPQE